MTKRKIGMDMERISALANQIHRGLRKISHIDAVLQIVPISTYCQQKSSKISLATVLIFVLDSSRC
jgi:hypothetical protein